MMMLNVAALHLVLVIPAVILISKDHISTKSQKGYQLLLTALLPVIGPVIMIIMGFYWRANPSARKSDVGDSAADHVNRLDRGESWNRH